MENFTFHNDTTIHFGRGQMEKLPVEVKRFAGSKVLVTFGSDRLKSSGLLAKARDLLETAGLSVHELGGIAPNPRVGSVREGVAAIREHGIDFLLAFGGGSVIDATKLMAAAASYDGDPWDFPKGTAKVTTALPIGTILTLAATGSEMNGNSVISNPDTQEKLPLASPLIRPRFSILDPELTYTVPAYQTAAGAADIISHVYEQYFSPSEHTEMQDRLAEAIILTVRQWGPVAVKEPENYDARANLLWAGTLALNGLLSVGKQTDWATHAMEHALSALYDVTHGAGLAILFPVWMEEVLTDDKVDRFYELAVRAWGVDPGEDRRATAIKGIRRTREFFSSLGLPATTKEVRARQEDVDILVEKSFPRGSDPLGSFGQVDKPTARRIFEKAYA